MSEREERNEDSNGVSKISEVVSKNKKKSQKKETREKEKYTRTLEGAIDQLRGAP